MWMPDEQAKHYVAKAALGGCIDTIFDPPECRHSVYHGEVQQLRAKIAILSRGIRLAGQTPLRGLYRSSNLLRESRKLRVVTLLGSRRVPVLTICCSLLAVPCVQVSEYNETKHLCDHWLRMEVCGVGAPSAVEDIEDGTLLGMGRSVILILCEE